MNAILEKALRGERLSDVLIIDFHTHLPGKWTGMHVAVQDSDEMIRRARMVGLSGLVMFGGIYPDMIEGNNMVAEVASRYPDYVIGFATVNPYQNDMAAEVRRCFEEFGFRGVKLHVMHEAMQSPFPMVSYEREWEQLFAYLSQEKAPVIYHGVVTEEMIRAWPDVPFIAAHGVGNPENMQRLSKYANFHVETASTQNPAWAVSRAVEIMGADRVLWGTDAPLDDFAQRLGVVLDSGLSERDMRRVLGLNAARLLQWET